MNKSYAFFDCANFIEPTDTTECPEVMWSNGKSCRKCPKKDCYRNGWKLDQVTEDNQRIAFNVRYKLANERPMN
jgi:hypothetical protein